MEPSTETDNKTDATAITPDAPSDVIHPTVENVTVEQAVPEEEPKPAEPQVIDSTRSTEPEKAAAPTVMQPIVGSARHIRSGRLSKFLVPVIVLLIGVVIGAGSTYALLGNKSDSNESTSQSTQQLEDAKKQAEAALAAEIEKHKNKANDVERQMDIRALQGHLEAYFAQNARYPTLDNVNDKAFRVANMKGLDDEALKDPTGEAVVLAAMPAPKVYSYAPLGPDNKPCDNNSKRTKNCTKFTLSATLENGEAFNKVSLN